MALWIGHVVLSVALSIACVPDLYFYIVEMAVCIITRLVFLFFSCYSAASLARLLARHDMLR